MTLPVPAKAVIVDDEEQILEICQDALADSFSIECFTNPIKALAYINEGGAPDVVITDIRMPEMSGIELLERIRKAGHHMPVVIVTGYADREAAVKGLNLGAFALIDKPFNLSSVTLTVHRAAAFELMRRNFNETLPRYMFLADTLNEKAHESVLKVSAAQEYVTSLTGEAKNAAEKIFAMLRTDQDLQAMVAKHEEDVRSLHEEEDRLNKLLKVLQVDTSSM